MSVRGEKKATGKEVDHKVWKQDLPPPSQKSPALSWALLSVGRGLCLPLHRYCWCYDSAICPSHRVRVNCSCAICKAWGDLWSASAGNGFGNSQRIREGENCLNILGFGLCFHFPYIKGVIWINLFYAEQFFLASHSSYPWSFNYPSVVIYLMELIFLFSFLLLHARLLGETISSIHHPTHTDLLQATFT